MDYQVYDPHPDLQAFIKCIWTLDDDYAVEKGSQRVVPDGCMEMIFHYGDRYHQHLKDGTILLQPRCFVFGQIDQYIEIEPTGRAGIIAARFLPGGTAPFFNYPLQEMENRAVDLETIFGEKGKNLETEVIQAINNDERRSIIEAFLLSRLEGETNSNQITRHCVDLIFRSRGQAGMNEISDQLQVNRRNMERKFAETVGMSPKQLSRVIRLQSTMRMLGEKKFSSLTSLAYENGYYDQAHFIRDFKEFTGISPKSFFADHLQLAGLFASAE